ncbi:MAG TPA: hypothetical protein VF621_13580, partial [Pyrinomonadaceae bacterium]
PRPAPRRKYAPKEVQAVAAAGRQQQQEVLTVDTVRGGAGAGRGLTVEALSARGGPSAFVESTRLLTKEQLVRALRLTGAKLRDVREKAQGADGSESRPQ